MDAGCGCSKIEMCKKKKKKKKTTLYCHEGKKKLQGEKSKICSKFKVIGTKLIFFLVINVVLCHKKIENEWMN